MPNFEPTPEQKAIVEEAKSSEASLLINALAGAAKTTTLELICNELRSYPILSIAFNKRIADEMKKRLPSHVNAMTINSLGHRIWGDFTKRRLTINTSKQYEWLKAYADGLTPKEKSEFFPIFSDVLKAASRAKIYGYIPEGLYPTALRLVETEEFFDMIVDDFEDDPPMRIIDEILSFSIQRAFAGEIDFDDQIYMPALFGGRFPEYPLVMVDEAQDLSSINHAFIDKLVRKRIIAVGDPYQSIYAFRGADSSSMSRLQKRYDMKEMTLSTSFRCPIEIVKLARSRAPHMQWASWAKPGEVNRPEKWHASEIPDGSAIICRNNAPLIKCAYSLLQMGRGVKLVGSDLGPGLIRALKKLGDEDMAQEKVLLAIDVWENEQLRKKKKIGTIKDRAECLRVFAGFGSTLGAAVAHAEHLFASGGSIQLLSGHKSKGLEWNTVYHLNSGLIPSPYAETPDQLEQEKNIMYVITTRAKQTLNFVSLDTLLP